jgi:deazaflavin-dependent oxidoreductase (nitroreductase family)
MLQRAWLSFINRTLNRLTLRLAHAGRGPFTIVRHVGRKSGRTFETPIVVARSGRDFVAELTYGDGVQWYRNVVAAGGCELVRGSRTATIVGVEPMSVEEGLAAFGGFRAVVLRLLRRHEFRRLVVDSIR